MRHTKSCGRKHGTTLDYLSVKRLAGWVLGLVHKVLGLIVSAVLGYRLV